MRDILRYFAWYADFCRIAAKVAIVNSANSEVSGPNVTKIVRNLEKFVLLNFLNSELFVYVCLFIFFCNIW